VTKLVVFSNDYIGAVMAGPGIRSYNFAKALAGDFDVTLIIPNDDRIDLDGVEVVTMRDRSAAALSDVLQPFDAVVAQLLPFATIRQLAHAGKRVIYDVYNPFLVETLAMFDVEEPDPAAVLFARSASLTQRFALATGSAFICASERQRDLWLGVLAEVGRLDLETYRQDRTLRNLIDVVPFGLPAEPPTASDPVLKGVSPGIGERDRVLLWVGGVWNWLDPLTPIRAVERIARRRRDVRLVFLGLTHPDRALPQMAMAQQAVELARSLGLLNEVVFFNHGWVPYEERQRYLLEADVGVSAHFDTLEARYAFRTRLLDHFWAGLPTVTTRGDVLADVIAARGLGRVVDFGDAEGWATAIEELLDEGDARERRRTRFEEVRSEYAWPSVVEPLIRLLRAPATPPRLQGRASLFTLEDRWLRLRTSLALGGVSGLLSRQAAKLRSRMAGLR
jgi:glycosyltransferase involved in cell wall biosynthesis